MPRMTLAKLANEVVKMRVGCALLLSLLSLPLLAAETSATPLEPQACASLKEEYDGLIKEGAQSDMDRGPDWAKTNLSPDKLTRIERLIEVKEQLSFRCDLMLTARPAIKEPPQPKEKEGKQAAKPGDDLLGNLGLSPIPPPKKKNAAVPQRKSP